MKKNILFIFILFSIISFSENLKEVKVDGETNLKFDYKLSLGFMIGNENILYKVNDEKDYNISPFIDFEVNNIYISGSEIGYKYQFNKQTEITAFTQLLGGLTLQGVGSAFGSGKLKGSKMKDGYKGIDDRKSQVEVGLRGDYETNFNDIQLSGEIHGGEIGSTAKLSILKPQHITDKFLFIPEFTFTLMDKNLVNHYFGVTKHQAMNSKSYKIDKSYQTSKLGHAFSLGLTGIYDINSDWSIFALSEVQFLSDNISNSPLLNDKTSYFLGVGLRYQFR